jgi:hypothetical protein
MKPEKAELDDLDEHPAWQTGARRVSDLEQDSELHRQLMPTDPPCADDEPFSVDQDALPTQPDLDAPPVGQRALVETYIDDLAVDSDDFRDTIPAPRPPPEDT